MSAEEWAALLEAAAFLARVRLGLPWSSAACLGRELVDPGKIAASIDADCWKQCRRLERMMSIAVRLLPGTSTCLHRSLALRRILARRGIHARLRLGVRKSTDVFEAHAWLELAGRVLNDRPDVADRYVVLDATHAADRLPPRGAYSI